MVGVWAGEGVCGRRVVVTVVEVVVAVVEVVVVFGV